LRRVLLIESDYREHRIEVTTRHVDGAWNAEVRIRRTLTEAKPDVETVTCRKPTAKVAEERGRGLAAAHREPMNTFPGRGGSRALHRGVDLHPLAHCGIM